VKDRTLENHAQFLYSVTADDLSNGLLHLQNMTAQSIVQLFNAIDCVEPTIQEKPERELLLGIEGASGSNSIDPDVNEPTGKAPLLQNPTLLELQRSDPEFASQLSAFIQDITGAIIEEITSAEDRQSALAEYVNLKQRSQ